MALLPLDLVRRLDDAFFEMSEIYDSRAHAVPAALALDPAFTNGNGSRSSLTRDLVSEAFLTAMSHVGLDARRGSGGRCEILEYMNGWYANIRLRSAELRSDGSHFVRANRASNFGYVDEALLEPNHDYVFGFTIDAEDQLNCFIAPVLDVIEGNPGELVLGDPYDFGGDSGSASTGFQPDPDSTLPGFEDDGEEDSESESA